MASPDILQFTPVELTGIVTAAVATGAVLMGGFVESPFSDQGSYIFPTASIEAFHAVVDVYGANGIKPRYNLSDTDVRRALMKDQGIVNVSNPNVADAMGPAGGVKVFRAKNPAKSLELSQDILEDYGFADTEVIEPMEAETKGKIIFLKSAEAYPNGVLGFRLSALKMTGGKKPSKYRSAEILPFTEPA